MSPCLMKSKTMYIELAEWGELKGTGAMFFPPF